MRRGAPEFDGAGCHALIIVRTDVSAMGGAHVEAGDDARDAAEDAIAELDE